jgi:DNA-binding NarL/FixJ family response regulator
VDVLEAAGATAPDDTVWAHRVLSAVRPMMLAEPGALERLGLLVVEHSTDGGRLRIPLTVTSGPYRLDVPVATDHHLRMLAVNPRLVRDLYYPPRIVARNSDLWRDTSPSARAQMAAFRREYGVKDSIGVVVHPLAATPLVLWAGFGRSPLLPRPLTTALTHVGLHLEAAYRLRKRPTSVLAVLRPDGRVVHLERTFFQRALLTERTRCIERARSRRTRRTSDALELWKVLIAGRASIVEREDGGQRLYFVVANPPARYAFRALSPDEVDTLGQVARGMSGKAVAYALGIAESTVAHRLAAASARLGLSSRVELVRLAAMLAHDPRAHAPPPVLTAAERDVLELLTQGLSNAEIAARRSRSVRTIANQVASMLAKTGSDTRRVLATRWQHLKN